MSANEHAAQAAADGLTDSEDLFDFDEIVAASASSTKSAPVDVDALLKAFEEKPSATSTAPSAAASVAQAVQAVANSTSSAPAQVAASAQAAPAAQPAPGASPVQYGAPQSVTISAAPVSAKTWVIAGAALGALLLLNLTLVWVSVHNAARADERIEALSSSMLALAQVPRDAVNSSRAALQAPSANTNTAAATTPVASSSTASAARIEEPQRQPPLADWDPDPRRKLDFERIEGLLESGLHAEARRQLYALLARCDGLVGSAKDEVEARASFLLAHALELEAEHAPSASVTETESTDAHASDATRASTTKTATAGAATGAPSNDGQTRAETRDEHHP